MGWLCVLGWQASAAAVAFQVGTQLQGLLVLNYPSYAYESWHGTLLTIAVSLFSVLFNTLLATELPIVEGIVLVVHLFAWCGLLVVLWVLAPMPADARAVLTTFSDNGGWGSLGGSALVGISTCILPLVGADAAAHMSEEVRDASRAVPRSMVWTTAVNGALGWVMTITFCFAVATMDLDEVLGSTTGYPFSKLYSPRSTTMLKRFKHLANTNGLSYSHRILQRHPVSPRCDGNGRLDPGCRNLRQPLGRRNGVPAALCLCARRRRPVQPLVLQGLSEMEPPC